MGIKPAGGQQVAQLASKALLAFHSPSSLCLGPLLLFQVLVTQLEAKQQGYADVVYLDAKTDT
jgi:hypothetical protein